MSVQDKTEQVLREILILLAKGEVYDSDTNRIIINKKEMIDLLKRLNLCISEIMDAYEVTQQARDKAERGARKMGEEIIRDASKKAEDVYAASFMYTDEALRRVLDIMQEATDSVKKVYDKMEEGLLKEKESVSRDKSELKSSLQNLRDTEMYMNLIEERSKKIAKEKAQEAKEEEPSRYAQVKPEIKINAEYFEKAGIPLGDQVEEIPEEKKEPVIPEVNVNLDAEYFKWIELDEEPKMEEKKVEKHSLLARILK